MKNKLIVIPNNKNNIKNADNLAFLFPVTGYSVGYNSFSFEEINSFKGSKYLLINRILTTNELEDLEEAIKDVRDIQGIFFEDIGVFQKLKHLNLKFIAYQNHFNTNYEGINVLLSLGVASAVISSDITKEEIEFILKKASKPLAVFLYGKTQIMYSRRNLVSNYNDFYHLATKDPVITEKVSKIEFKLSENDHGTIVYDNNFYDASSLINEENDENILYYLVSLYDLKDSEASKVIEYLIKGNYSSLKKIKKNTNNGFLEKETIYRVRGQV